MTWTEISSPTFSAAAAPASVAAFTAPTSPRTITVTRPPPTCSLPTSCTLADLTMASAASMAPTSPFVSIMPKEFVSIVFPSFQVVRGHVPSCFRLPLHRRCRNLRYRVGEGPAGGVAGALRPG